MIDHSYKRKLEEIYRRYGFELAKFYENEEVIVFTLKTGYFDNADIVPLSDRAVKEKAFSDFSTMGFACSNRGFLTLEDAEEQLFKGFFSVESILDRLSTEYSRFTSSIVSHFSEAATYQYINAPYQVNGRIGELSPACEVVSRLGSSKPTLFLIEAAAGFGKTCTAYELVNEIKKQGKYLPLFSELSRNRQAVIFRHILLDEIDRTFPMLNSRLVQSELKNGRVITILDGFDELLRKTDEGTDFESKEPMLETIGEFLTGNAKIVLTTRRTVLFEGDAFHAWVENHLDKFDLVKIRISEPLVTDWLSSYRHTALKDSGINVEDIANPVLLSYLRCIVDEEFDKLIEKSHQIVDKYFEFMLERETKRQDLRLDLSKQQKILSSIAEDMMEYGYTSESRDYIVDHILKVNSKMIDEALLLYSSGERPSKEEISNKLASHALLDRNSREPNKIGFINEFVFGHFIGMNIINKSDWLSDDIRFIEPAVVSYQPRQSEDRNVLLNKLLPSLDFLSISDRIDITVRLKNCIDFDLLNDEAKGLSFIDQNIGTNRVVNFQFNECVFNGCVFNLSLFNNVTFLSCKYYDCTVNGKPIEGVVYELGGSGDQNFIANLLASNVADVEEIEPDRKVLLERFILEKFWPDGRESISYKHRPIKGVCVSGGTFKPNELYSTITSLKRKSILLEPNQTDFIEINFEKINLIKEILGRGVVNGS